jgi:hypothetical protein
MKSLSKIIVTVLLFSCLSHSELKGQFYYTLGYNAGFPTGLEQLNFVIQRYNDTRTYLTEPMKKINFLDGFTFTMGGVVDVVFVDFGYTAGIQRRFAEGPVSGTIMRRDLKVSSHLFDFNFGFCLADPNKSGIYVGASMNIGKFSIKTRVSEKETIKSENYVQINPDDDLFFTLGVFMKFCIKNPGIYIQPYYQFPMSHIFDSDMTDVNEILNPYTYENDPSPLNINNGTFGVKIGFSMLSKE